MTSFSMKKTQNTFVFQYFQYKFTAFYAKQPFCYEDSCPLFKQKYQENF